MIENESDLSLVGLLADWMEAYTRIYPRRNAAGAAEQIAGELDPIEVRMASLPAGTIQGAATKAGLLARIKESGVKDDALDQLAASLYADVERLAKEASAD